MTAPLKVGDLVWIVRKDARMGEPFQVEITKVGRLYAQTNRRCRINLNDNRATDGDFHVGQVWRCIDDYHEKARMDKDWHEFVSTIRNNHTRPSHLTSADIADIEQRLFPSGELVRMEWRI